MSLAKLSIKKGDNVAVILGKDRGQKGKVMNVFPAQNKIIVENINLKKKRVKPKKQGEKGQIVNVPSPFNASNAMVICKNCGKRTRIGKKILEDKSKVRVCKKCGGEI